MSWKVLPFPALPSSLLSICADLFLATTRQYLIQVAIRANVKTRKFDAGRWGERKSPTKRESAAHLVFLPDFHHRNSLFSSPLTLTIP